MRTLELFAGTGSFSKVMAKYNHSTFRVELDPGFNNDLTGDLLDSDIQQIVMSMIKNVDVVWMSPVCTAWSLSAGNTHFNQFRQPKTELAVKSINMMMFCRLVADECVKQGKIFFIENPNGRAVWIMDNQYRKRVWYCQYGDNRAKPTNIWTNLDIEFKTCKNNNPDCDHESAPRGSKTGTQGLKNSKERSVIPAGLFEHILEVMGENKLEVQCTL